MNVLSRDAVFVRFTASLLAAFAVECSASSQGGTAFGSGGAAGGNAVSGGATATGGVPGATGGAAPSGGGVTGSGGGVGGAGTTTGGVAMGGSAPSAGGSTASGGASSGGTMAVGGTAGTSGGGSVAGAGNGGAGGGGMITCPATSTLPKGETTQMLQVGGVSRSYILHVPAKYDGKSPAPLVVDWHPILSTAQFERGNSGYAALSDQEGFIVAFPQGIDNAWNIGPCCTTSRTVDDLGFARALVDEIESQGCIDPKRVYSTGYSMGGGMTHYLACNAADVFATATPSAFDLLEEDEEPCHPSRPITVLSFRGSADPIVPYAGGASNPPNGLAVTIHFLGAVGTFQKWAMLDGCTGNPTTTSTNCQTYSQCNAGVEVTLCTAPGGGHVTGDAAQGWAMMKKHPMP